MHSPVILCSSSTDTTHELTEPKVFAKPSTTFSFGIQEMNKKKSSTCAPNMTILRGNNGHHLSSQAAHTRSLIAFWPTLILWLGLKGGMCSCSIQHPLPSSGRVLKCPWHQAQLANAPSWSPRQEQNVQPLLVGRLQGAPWGPLHLYTCLLTQWYLTQANTNLLKITSRHADVCF